jgi:hypothetical protein
LEICKRPTRSARLDISLCSPLTWTVSERHLIALSRRWRPINRREARYSVLTWVFSLVRPIARTTGGYILPALIGFQNSAFGPRVRVSWYQAFWTFSLVRLASQWSLDSTVAGSPIIKLPMYLHLHRCTDLFNLNLSNNVIRLLSLTVRLANIRLLRDDVNWPPSMPIPRFESLDFSPGFPWIVSCLIYFAHWSSHIICTRRLSRKQMKSILSSIDWWIAMRYEPVFP